VRLRESQGDRRPAGHPGASSGIVRVLAYEFFVVASDIFIVTVNRVVANRRGAREIAPFDIDIGIEDAPFPVVGLPLQRALSRS
jgi:hypothetical protein